MGWALLATLRTVAEREKSDALLWTGSWTEPSVQAVQSGPSAARLRGIRAGSAYDAWSRTSHNPPVVGSSPTRPTCDFTRNTGQALELDIKGGRHYTASQLLAGGFDLRNTAARLGHSGGATTLRHYADPVPEVDRRAAAYLAQLTAGPATQSG